MLLLVTGAHRVGIYTVGVKSYKSQVRQEVVSIFFLVLAHENVEYVVQKTDARVNSEATAMEPEA